MGSGQSAGDYSLHPNLVGVPVKWPFNQFLDWEINTWDRL